MYYLFLSCFLLGGTVFILQFILTVIGVGADGLDLGDGVPGDVDIPGDAGDLLGHAGDHGSTWMFGVISFRTIVAALTFFGLAGMASRASQLSAPITLLAAVAAGAVAMYSVHFVMRFLYRQGQDDTVRISRTVGERGTVYIPIPPNNSGLGKIQLRTQGRIMEYAAKTPAPKKLSTGTTVEVVSVLTPRTVEVEPVDEAALSLEESGTD